MLVEYRSPAEKRYDRIAWLYDAIESPMEFMASRGWRKRLFSLVEGHDILEVGVGTGKNLPYYPSGKSITAIDVSGRMLKRARERASRLNSNAVLKKMDIERMDFSDAAFDAAVSTFVFCSVPDPLKGLLEVKRVLKASGHVYLLEHVRPAGMLGHVFDILNPFVSRIIGPNINRDTVGNIRKTGFRILTEENLVSDIFKLVVAEKTE